VKAAPALIERLPAADHLLADTAYDSDTFRQMLAERNTIAVIKPNPTRKREVAFEQDRYKARNTIERAFSHIKDWRRVATRYDKLARNFQAGIAIAAVILWWA
jgi:transposase